MRRNRHASFATVLAGILTTSSAFAGGPAPQPGGFSYQFVLRQNGQPYNGTCDFEFRLWDGPHGSGATQVGPMIPTTQTITDGTSNTILLFEQPPPAPPVWNGEERWLEVRVRTPAGSANPFVGLTPWQRITSTPYAAYALNSPFGLSNGNAVFTQGSVGVGTATPLSDLHVFDDAGSAADVLLESADNAAGISMVSDATGNVRLYSPDGGDDFRIAMGGVDLLALTTSGRLGVGTATPNVDLHVFDDGGLTADALIHSADNAASLTLQSDAAGAVKLYSPDESDEFRISLNGTDLLGLTTSGRLGVGTGTPGVDLHVYEDTLGLTADIMVESLENAARILLSSDATNPVILYSPDGSDEFRISLNNIDLLGLTAAGRLGVGTATPNVDLHVYEDGTLTADVLVQSLANAAQLHLSSDLTNSVVLYSPDDSDDFRLSTSAIDRMTVTAVGNVGIGLTTPATPLHVQEGAAGTIAPHSNTSLVLERSNNNYLQMYAPDASEAGILFGGDTIDLRGGIFFNPATTLDGLQFRTGGNFTRAVIDATGRFGVGTTAPANLLHVTGPGTATGGGALTEVVAHFRNSTALQNTAVSVDAVLNEDPVLYLAQNGTALWNIRYDDAQDALEINKGNTGGTPALSFNGAGTAFAAEFLGHVKPYDTDLLDLGTNVDKWRDIYATNGVIITSDRRAKTDIIDIDDGLQRLMQLRPVSYFRLDRDGSPLHDRRHLGLIAQEVAPIVPEAVRAPANSDEMYAMQYDMLIPLLIDATQTLERENQSLRDENAALAQRLAALEITVEQLALREQRQ